MNKFVSKAYLCLFSVLLPTIIMTQEAEVNLVNEKKENHINIGTYCSISMDVIVRSQIVGHLNHTTCYFLDVLHLTTLL